MPKCVMGKGGRREAKTWFLFATTFQYSEDTDVIGQNVESLSQ